MATDEERLIVSVEARVNQLEKEMKRGSRVFGNEMTRMENRAKQSGDRLESTLGKAAARANTALKGIGAGLIGGIAAGGVIGIVGQLGQVAAGIAEIGDQAKRAGVSTTIFQEWATVATQARIPVDSLIDGLKELQLRGDEFSITGKGSAAEAFARLGYSAEELKRKLADPSALLLEIIERLGKFHKAAQIRIADEVFGGTGGERFVELLDRGADSIRHTIDEAHRLGNILDSDVITRAAEVDRQFKLISQTVGTALKGAIIDAVGALQQFIDSFRAFENQQNASLDAQLATIGAQTLDLENKILKLKGQQADGGLFSRDVSGDIQYLEQERAALQETEAQILAVVEARRKAAEAPAPAPASTFTPAPYTPPPATGGTGGSTRRDASAAAADREANAVRRLIAELERERALIGATDLERQISDQLRNAGAGATEQQRARIVALVTAIEAETRALDMEKDAQDRANDAKREFGELAMGAMNGFVQDVLAGKTAAEALSNMLKRLASQLAEMAVKSAFMKLFGGIFGFSEGGLVQGFASGGHVRGPGTSTSDSIPARLSDGEFVVNAAATRKHRALLEAVNDNRVPAFAAGGPAGKGLGTPAPIGGQIVNISAPVTVNGSAGTPEQNADLAKRLGRQMEATMRDIAASEMMRAARPGGWANQRGR